KAGVQTLTATDTITSSISGTSTATTVNPGVATKFTLTGNPSTATAGDLLSFTVTALDTFNNTSTGYAGTVHYSTTDTLATAPADAVLTNGVGTASYTVKKAGVQTLTATDTASSSINGTSAATTVSAAAATRFTVSAPGNAV